MKVFKKKGGFFQMKKIIGILLAGAMAFSAFAADVSAKVNLEGELLNITDGAVKALNINKPSDQHWNPIMNLAINGDQAGDEFAVFTGATESAGSWNTGFGVHVNRFKIWFSPLDGLKFNFGLIGFGLNQEQILWSKSESNPEGYGYGVSYSNSGFGVDLAFLPGWDNNWLDMPKGGDVAIAETTLKLEYNADFGKINALLDAKETFKDIKFGVGYANNFAGINMFANVLGYVNNGFNKLRVELYAAQNIDAFGWKLFLAPNINLGDAVAVDLQLIARADYNFGAANVYLLIGGDGLYGRQGCKFGLVNNKDFTMTVAPGVNGNVGGASWDVSLKFDIVKGSPIIISVPVVFSMGW